MFAIRVHRDAQMQDLRDSYYAEIMALNSVFRNMNCTNTSEFLRNRPGRDFFAGAVRNLYADARTVRFAGETSGLDNRIMGTMRRSAVTSLDLLAEKLGRQPGKRAKYRQVGMKPFDVERAWFNKRFNADVIKARSKMDGADAEALLRQIFKIHTSFALNVRKPYAELYRDCVKNVLGSASGDMSSLIEETFCFDTVFVVNGKKVSDLRWMRRMYREKRYTIKGDVVSFDGVPGKPRLSYRLWELLVIAMFMQRKVLLASTMFCLIDIEKMRQTLDYYERTVETSGVTSVRTEKAKATI